METVFITLLVILVLVVVLLLAEYIKYRYKISSLYRLNKAVKWFMPMAVKSHCSNGFRYDYHSGMGTVAVEPDLVRVCWYDSSWSGKVDLTKIQWPIQWFLSQQIYKRFNNRFRIDSDEFEALRLKAEEIKMLTQYKKDKQ